MPYSYQPPPMQMVEVPAVATNMTYDTGPAEADAPVVVTMPSPAPTDQAGAPASCVAAPVRPVDAGRLPRGR
jgi:hypothetical protein